LVLRPEFEAVYTHNADVKEPVPVIYSNDLTQYSYLGQRLGFLIALAPQSWRLMAMF